MLEVDRTEGDKGEERLVESGRASFVSAGAAE